MSFDLICGNVQRNLKMRTGFRPAPSWNTGAGSSESPTE